MSDDATPPPPPERDPTPPPAQPPPPAASNPLLGTVDTTAPAFGSGKLSASDDKTFCILAQFFSFIIWPWKKDESPAVNAWGKEALNFLLTVLPIQIVLSLLSRVHFVGCIVSLLSTLVGLASLVLAVIAALKASEGKLFRYPVNFRFIK